MSEHDDTLRKTLQEVTRLRSEREESLREVATNEYSGRLRHAERIYWLYALACVALGVAAINFFVRSFDIKTLIGCAVVMLVIYETTVLMKLWFATARMKLDTLKEMKLLRLEVARLGTAVGVEQPSPPPVKYEPMPGMPHQERLFWLVMCVLVAIAVSTWTSHAWFGGGAPSTKTLVTLAADGSAEKQYAMERAYAGYYLPKGFSLYTPKDTKVRVLDPTGHEMPVQLVVTDTNHRHDVTFTDSVFDQGKMRYTQVLDVPHAATLEDGIWTCRDGMHHVGFDTQYSITILLPPGAKLLSADPTATVEPHEDGRTHVRFQGMAKDGQKYAFTVRYELPSKSVQEE
jgi:hypothetical protein